MTKREVAKRELAQFKKELTVSKMVWGRGKDFYEAVKSAYDEADWFLFCLRTDDDISKVKKFPVKFLEKDDKLANDINLVINHAFKKNLDWQTNEVIRWMIDPNSKGVKTIKEETLRSWW